MARPTSLEAVRARYAQAIARLAGCPDTAVQTAFAKVAREDFLPAPPWVVFEPGIGGPHVTSEPADLYRDVLAVIDNGKGINNGQPSLHAAWIAAAAPRPGDHIVHVGCGGGYYSAILAELAGLQGKVFAYEIEPQVGALAQRTLAGLANVDVRIGSGASGELPPAEVIYVNAAAPAPQESWLRALRPGGRLLFPWDAGGEGASTAMLIARPADDARDFAARAIGQVRFIPLRSASERGDAHAVTGRIAKIRSLIAHAERAPDGSAVAIFAHYWFSTMKSSRCNS